MKLEGENYARSIVETKYLGNSENMEKNSVREKFLVSRLLKPKSKKS